MSDTRPAEPIQHSFEHYGRFVLQYYGKEAYLEWLRSKGHSLAGCRAHVCTEICNPKAGQEGGK